jgi:hypothetical protein
LEGKICTREERERKEKEPGKCKHETDDAPMAKGTTIYDALKSSAYDRVYPQFVAETTKELHEALCSLWLHCVTQETCSEDIRLIDAAACAEVVRIFKKMGVYCHIDTRPSPPTELSAYVTVISGPSQWGTHSICFTIAQDVPKTHCRGPV